MTRTQTTVVLYLLSKFGKLDFLLFAQSNWSRRSLLTVSRSFASRLLIPSSTLLTFRTNVSASFCILEQYCSNPRFVSETWPLATVGQLLIQLPLLSLFCLRRWHIQLSLWPFDWLESWTQTSKALFLTNKKRPQVVYLLHTSIKYRLHILLK